MHSRALIVAVLASSLSFGSFAGTGEPKSISQLANQGQHAKALDDIDGYLATHPEDVQGQFLKGVTLGEQKKTAEAIKVFSAISEQHPELPEPYNNLAVLYAEQGQYDKARLALETALKTHPSYATAHENLSDVYAKMASAAYDKALQLDGKDARTQTRLAIKLAMVKTLFPGSTRPVQTAFKAPEPIKAASPTPAPVAKTPVSQPVPNAVPTPPQPKPAAPSEQEKPADSGNGDQQALIDAVQDWAKAWSAQDADAYLAYYAGDFKTPGGESRKAWEKSRRARIAAPRSIRVGLADIKIALDGNKRASVRFKQSYRADRGTIRTTKTLVMEKSGGKWRIEQELTAR